MKRVTIETTDHSYQGRILEHDTALGQYKVTYLDENRERVVAWYNADICEVERVAPAYRGGSEADLGQQQAMYQELIADGYGLKDDLIALGTPYVATDEEIEAIKRTRWDGADYLCQFEKDGVKFYLPNNEDWFDVIAVDHEHKLAVSTGFCEYGDIKADHGEYTHRFHDGKLVMGMDL